MIYIYFLSPILCNFWPKEWVRACVTSLTWLKAAREEWISNRNMDHPLLRLGDAVWSGKWIRTHCISYSINGEFISLLHKWDIHQLLSQIAKFMGSAQGPPGSCRPQMGPMLAPWTLLLGVPLGHASVIATMGVHICFNTNGECISYRTSGTCMSHWYDNWCIPRTSINRTCISCSINGACIGYYTNETCII